MPSAVLIISFSFSISSTIVTQPVLHNLFPVLNLQDGNVGIGTTTPAQKLVVVGDVNITGNLTVAGNITLKSPDGTNWDCGVNDSGVFSCS